jgi:hypothetical protein
MALRQFDISLIPRKKIEELYSQVPERIDIEVYEQVDWWKGYRLQEDYQALVDHCLSRNKPWLPHCLEWGTEDTNRISVGLHGDDIDWIWVRIDVRTRYDELVACVVDLAKRLDCLMLLEHDMMLIQPNEPELLMRLKSSRASKLFKSFTD